MKEIIFAVLFLAGLSAVLFYGAKFIEWIYKIEPGDKPSEPDTHINKH